MRQNKKYPILIVIILSLLISLACGFSSNEQLQKTDVTFKTPEEAINYYFEGLTQADTHKILGACAIDEMSEKFNFDLYSERVGFLSITTLSPTRYPLYVELNKTELSGEILKRVKVFNYSLLSNEEVHKGTPILTDAERTNNFIKDVNPSRLSKIEIQKIEMPSKEFMNSPKYLEDAAKIAGIYGADESTERVVLFSFEDGYYYVGFILLRYGESWKISSQIAPLANTSPLGAAEKTTIAEFDAMFNGD